MPTTAALPAANNQGLAVARGETPAAAEPRHDRARPGAIDRMLDWLAGHPEVGCVGCQVLEGPGVIQQTSFADPAPLNLLIAELGLKRCGAGLRRLSASPGTVGWDRTSERDVDVVSGMFMLVPRAVLATGSAPSIRSLLRLCRGSRLVSPHPQGGLALRLCAGGADHPSRRWRQEYRPD